MVEPYLYIVKNSSAMGSYDDGIFIKFGDKSPQHITFEMFTEDPDIETCDFRLTSFDNTTANVTSNGTANNGTTLAATANKTNSTNTTVSVKPLRENFTKAQWQDVAFFRFGYFNYQKLNLVSMV